MFQGGLALGGIVWGAVATHATSRTALLAAAATLIAGVAATRRWPLATGVALDLRPSLNWPEPKLELEPRPDEGPVLVTVEYTIDPRDGSAFAETMREVGRLRRRDGAIQWGVYHDAAEPSRYVETFLVESWVEHLRQHQRGTLADRAIEERGRAFHVGDTPPRVSHLIHARPDAETG